MLGRETPTAASRCGNACKATRPTLPLIFGAPQSVGRTLLQRGMTAVDWHALTDAARSFDPTFLGGRSSTPQRVNRLRGTVGQEHSEHRAMLITKAAAHESRWVLDSPGSLYPGQPESSIRTPTWPQLELSSVNICDVFPQVKPISAPDQVAE
jgi:hypothetical protein